METLGRQSLIAILFASAFLSCNAETSTACLPVHQTLKELGAGEFSNMLKARSVDFKYGEFTIFAPSDELLRGGGVVLTSNGHNSTTIDDIVLFHVSAEQISENITDPEHCGKSLVMLNEELHVNQESSVTDCDGGNIYQVGPGNIGSDVMPEVIGEPVQTCYGVIYTIQGSLMLPTLPNVTLPPTTAPKPTKPPTRQSGPTSAPTKAPVPDPGPEPEPEPESSGRMLLSSANSFAIVVSVLVIAYL